MIQIGRHTLYWGDCLAVLPTLEAESIDTIITDSPYGLGFMGRDWDTFKSGAKLHEEYKAKKVDKYLYDISSGKMKHVRWAIPTGGRGAGSYDFSRNAEFQAWCTSWAGALLRVAKPGAMLLAFGGTRTWHRLVCALEDAGWEIRDAVLWLYGSGFPKSLDIGKALDKAAGVSMETRGHFGYTQADDSATPGAFRTNEERANPGCRKAAPTTDAAKQWDGWGTGLKPAWEPIVVAMKPLDGSFAQNAIKHGVAGLNVDGGRIGTTKDVPASVSQQKPKAQVYGCYGVETGNEAGHNPNLGRWPANAILDEDAAAMLDEQSGESKSSGGQASLGAFRDGNIYGKGKDIIEKRDPGLGDTGGASRFFYTAKASRSERGRDNKHPTVKPVALIEYLCKLTATPTGGVVLDPFMGSGTTGVACERQGRTFIGIDKERRSWGTACRRMRRETKQVKFDFGEPA